MESEDECVLEKAVPVKLVHPNAGSVTVTKYESRDIGECCNGESGLLVVSEIYYPAGWKAYITARKRKSIRRTTSCDRWLCLPGSHSVEFRFDPSSYSEGYTITQSAWGVTAILIVLGLLQSPAVRRRLKLGERVILK